MARKAAAPRGARGSDPASVAGGSAVRDRPMPDGYGDDEMGDRRRGRASWGGAGGRWWIWVGRAVLWALIIVIVVNGVRAPFERFTAWDTGGSAQDSDQTAFPKSRASAYALQFANAYLNYDAKDPDARAHKLAAFLPDANDQQFGWNGSGTMTLDSAQVADVDTRDDTHAVVRLAVSVNDHRMQLAVPVYAAKGAMVVTGKPALMPAPRKATPPKSDIGTQDEGVESNLKKLLPRFFEAYAGGDAAELDRYLAPGASATGLSGAVQYVGIKEVIVAQGGDRRHATVTVTWRISDSAQGQGATAGELDQTYDLVIVKDEDKWDIEQIHGSTQPAGS